MQIETILAVVFSYLIGSIPTAYIFGRLYKNIDIRQHGSGNIGATNVFRVLGKIPGITVLLLDIIKGVVPVVIIGDALGANAVWQRLLLAVAAVCGHNWTVFLQFKGGKGIATSLGVLIGLTIKIASIRPVLLWTLAAWIAAFLATATVSIASILAAIVLPLSMVFTSQPLEITCLGIVFCVFVILRHRPNIARIFAGQEPKVPLPFRKKNP